MSELTIKYQNDVYEKGAEIDVVGVGLITNGGTLAVSEETQERYEGATGIKLRDAIKENPCLSIVKGKSEGSDS